MRFAETTVPGAFVIDPERFEDDRGFFARTWDTNEFERKGLNPRLVQASVSWNRSRGTLRGMHFQRSPHEEAKLVRCTAGAIFDVCVDLRPASRTYTRWVGVELAAENGNALYIPEGCAHGFLTLADRSEVSYQMSAFYSPEAAGGVRWDDPAFGIDWPEDVRVINDRDRSWPDFQAEVTG